MKSISSIFLTFAAFIPSLNAAIIPEAERALNAGGNDDAIRISKDILSDSQRTPESSAKAMLILAMAYENKGEKETASAWATKVNDLLGAPDSEGRKAQELRIRLAPDAKSLRRRLVEFLDRWPAGEDASRHRLALAKIIERSDGPTGALNLLRNRPAADKKAAYDAAVSQEENRLAIINRHAATYSVSNDESSDAQADALFAKGDFIGAEKLYAQTMGSAGFNPKVRLAALRGRLLALEEAGNSARAAATAGAGLVGVPADTFPPELDLLIARLKLDYADDAMTAESWARKALAACPPDSPVLEDTRWLLARALARRGADRPSIDEAVKDSPTIRRCPFPPDSPLHPVTRVITQAARGESWISSDLGTTVTPPLSPMVKAADSCFAANRFTDAAKLYARYLQDKLIQRDARAYATLQYARALAQTDKKATALPVYTRFVSDKTLVASKLAPAARLRAGVLCAGPLRDTKAALRWYDELMRDAPGSPEARIAATHRIAILELNKPSEAIVAKKVFIQAHTMDPISLRYKNDLSTRSAK